MGFNKLPLDVPIDTPVWFVIGVKTSAKRILTRGIYTDDDSRESALKLVCIDIPRYCVTNFDFPSVYIKLVYVRATMKIGLRFSANVTCAKTFSVLSSTAWAAPGHEPRHG